MRELWLRQVTANEMNEVLRTAPRSRPVFIDTRIVSHHSSLCEGAKGLVEGHWALMLHGFCFRHSSFRHSSCINPVAIAEGELRPALLGDSCTAAIRGRCSHQSRRKPGFIQLSIRQAAATRTGAASEAARCPADLQWRNGTAATLLLSNRIRWSTSTRGAFHLHSRPIGVDRDENPSIAVKPSQPSARAVYNRSMTDY